jgi:hypothetical protein
LGCIKYLYNLVLIEIGDFNIRLKTGLCLISLWIFVVGLISINPFAYADSDIQFTPETPFSIPNSNGTIYFAINGTYSRALLENNTWIFSDLQLSNLQTLKTFNVSVQNCSMTIILSEGLTGYYKQAQPGLVQYNVTGPGIQVFNFGLNPSFGLSSKYRDLMVFFTTNLFTNGSDIRAIGDGWQVASDGTITIAGVTKNATIIYVDYSPVFNDTTLPFYQNHSVTITAVILSIAMMIIGIMIKIKDQKTRH